MNTNNIELLITFLSNYIKIEQEEIDFLSEVLLYKKYKQKEIVCREGELQRYLAFILKGAVRFFYTDEQGEENTVEFAFENMPIGQYKAMISNTNYPASVETVEPTQLIAISKESFLSFLEKYPRYYLPITKILGNALDDIESRNKLLRIHSSRERYETLQKKKPKVVQRIPLTHIASYLKMAPGTLSRVRAGKL